MLAPLRCRSSTKKKMSRPADSAPAGLSGAAVLSAPPARDAAAANCASSRRLPALTRSKKVTGCVLPLTCNSNCSGRRSSTKRPRLSKTATSVCTSSVVTRTTSSSCSGAGRRGCSGRV